MNLFSGMPLLTIILSLVIPVVTALVSRPGWTSKVVMGLISMLLAAANGFFTQWYQSDQAHTSFNVTHGVEVSVLSFLVAVAVHYGVLKDTDELDTLLAFPSSDKVVAVDGANAVPKV